MAPVNKGKVLFTCREATCGKNVTDRSNRDRHEKRFNHKPLKHKSKEPLFDDTAKEYKCATPGCTATSEFKGNIARHMKDCAKQTTRKEQKTDNKICPYFGKVFVQKSNRYRHMKNQHEVINHTFADKTFGDGTVVPLTFVPESDRNDQPGPSNLSPNASYIESAPNQTTELLNVPFISNDGNIVEKEMTEIENETPIYEVFEQPFTIPTSPVHEANHDNELNESNKLSKLRM